MTIQEVYQHYQIPLNLQTHMYRVASVGVYISNNYSKQGSLSKQDIVQTLLLHDLGNLLKFDFSMGLDLLDESERDEAHWRKVQTEMRETYGPTVHEATYAMAKKLKVSERVLELVDKMGVSHLAETVSGSDMENKISAYSDLRVAPFKLVTVNERFDDIAKRYLSRPDTPAERAAQIEESRELCLLLEKQIQAVCDVDLKELPPDLINGDGATFQELIF